jgi:hypothetical protein
MKIIVLFSVLFLAACSGKDEQFCQCLSAGETLNEYTQQFFDKTPSAAERSKTLELKTAKSDACKDYQLMSGAIMRQKKKQCEK